MGIFSDPQKNIDQAGVLPGMKIADIGSGTGAYTIAAAKALVGSGTVFAIDIHKDMLSKLSKEVASQKLYNVEYIYGDASQLLGTHLKSGTIDLVLLCNVLFQIEDKQSLCGEIKRILVPGGRVLVVDWADSFGGIGPHKDKVFTEARALALWQSVGFAKEKSISASAHHYGMICKKL